MKAAGHAIIVMGASAGGVAALMELCRALPKDLEAAVFAVVHTSPTSPGVLPQILDRSGPLVAVSPRMVKRSRWDGFMSRRRTITCC